MDRTRRTFFGILGTAAIAGAALYVDNYCGGDGCGLPNDIAGPTVEIDIASSVTKQKWMESVIAKFEDEGHETSDGSAIKVSSTGVLSGGSMWNILDGSLKPVVWSPGATSWVEQFHDNWRQLGRTPAIKQECQPSIYSPIGIAMWRPMAEALGWPDQAIGWKTIVDLASDPNGWGSYGHPEWGQLKLGHPHPEYSSAGMLYLTSLAYGTTGSAAGLTAEHVYSQDVTTAMSDLAQNTHKYGMISTDLLRLMAQHGPDYLHAVSAFEEGTVRLNLERGDDLRWPVVFIFPSEGTFWSSHPYCILDGADWVDEQQSEAARIFLDFLLGEDQQRMAVENLLRPLDSSVPVSSPLSIENGADPRVRIETVPALEVPDSATTAAIIDQFLITKRKATVMVALDVSGSMQGKKIRTAADSSATFLERLYPDDKVGLMTFNDALTTVSYFHPVSEVVETLSARTRNLIAGGGTALYDAVCRGMHILQRERERDQNKGEHRLYGMIVLSDGQDKGSSITENQMFARCLPSGAEANGIKVFPIAFGADADSNVLTRIASVTGGRMYQADPASIERAYLRISAEQ